MKLVENTATFLGWTFLIVAAFVWSRPGGRLHGHLVRWQEAKEVRTVIRDHWDEIVSGNRHLGRTEGNTTLVEFIDYRCFYCRTFHDSLNAFFSSNLHAKVAIRFKILRNDSISKSAALAAVCAGSQGRFDRMHDFLLSDTVWYKTPDWARAALSADIERLEAFHNCMDSDEAREVIRRDSIWAESLLLRGTPAFISRTKGVHLGELTLAEFAEWMVPP